MPELGHIGQTCGNDDLSQPDRLHGLRPMTKAGSGRAATLRHPGFILLITTALASMPNTAFAQSQAASSPQAGAQPAAQPDDRGERLEEIIVTAQRRSENLQSVPVTVKAITAAALEQQNITTGLDIAKAVPTLSLGRSSGTVQVYIRGVGNNVDAQGNEPSNALYVDGVYYSRLLPSLFRFNNIEQIEVLKGPQGTLFGRNAEGGLIQIRTKDPVPGSPVTGEISAGYGSFDTRQATAYLASGIGDKVAADVAVSYYNNPGFGRNVFNNEPGNYERSFAIRGKVVIDLQEGTRIVLAADYNASNTDIGFSGQKPGSPFPGGANTGFPDGSALLPRIGYYDFNQNEKKNYFAEQYGGHITVEQDLGFAKLVSITAYHKNNEVYALDSDFGPVKESATNLPSFNAQFTQELQLQSKAKESFDWTVGLFYLNIQQGFFDSTIAGPRFAPPASALLINSAAPTKSYAAYGQATFTVAPKLKLTVGARFSHDEINGNGRIDVQTPGGIFSAVPYDQSKTLAQRLTGKVVLSYQFTDDVMTYASASRGYKSGLYNILTYSKAAPFVKPEVLDAFEVGVKSELFDRTLRLNVALFYNDFKNPQVQIVDVKNGGILSLVNAGKARTYGAEFDALWAPVQNLNITASAGYLNAEYTDFTNAPFYFANPVSPFGVTGPVSMSANGNKIPRSPGFTGNIGFNYKVPLGAGNLLLSSNYAYTGKFYWTPQNRDKQDGYGLLDARIAYELPNGLTVSVWGSNLTGEKYQTFGQTQPGFGGDFGGPGAPRQYGVNASFKF